jgi:DNA repair exonuclease SbcCD nuclease subunit
MKFVHIADMHFDTSFSQMNDSNLGTLRRLDQRKVFKKIIDYIKENEIEYFFIAGDLYEHKFIKESTIEYINNLFKEIENTKIFITPGNHDPFLKNSYYNKFKWNDNVHIFGPNVTMVSDKNVNIYGYGFDDFYYTNSELEDFELTEKDKINILITHGTLNGSNNLERQYNSIQKSNLEKIGFDYVALGHIHKNNYSNSEKILYPGSTISTGFDEEGKHGMIAGCIDENGLKTEFISLDDKEFKVLEVDVSEFNSAEDLIEYLNIMNLDDNNFYEIYFVGRRSFELDLYNFKKLIYRPNIIKLKNLSKINYNIEQISNETTLKGLFVKELLEEMNNNEYDKELLEQALEIGLEILEK